MSPGACITPSPNGRGSTTTPRTCASNGNSTRRASLPARRGPCTPPFSGLRTREAAIYLLSHARRKAQDAGKPIPTVWKTLANAGVFFRRSQISMIAAAPGVGKSAFTLNLAIRSGCRGIYMSADSDETTQAYRAAAILTGDKVGDIEAAYRDGRGAKYDMALADFKRIWFDFDASPDLTHIEEEVLAYAHLYGRWPELLVLDNLANVWDEGSGEGF